MASKQRSFFDQKPAARQWKPRWPRPANEPAQPVPRVPHAPPPIAPSAQSRRKLDSFRYRAANAGDAMGTNENAARLPHGKAATTTSPDVSRPREYPQTPVARVPFADLVENGETLTVVSPIKTPQDGVTWKQSPTSSDGSLLSQRGKKRARSSSPPPSSQRSLHLHRMMPAPVNLQNLHSSFKGGHVDNDPAMDLEKRYFGNTRLVTPSKLPSSAAADLMRSSSPRTPGLDLTDSAKLRRTRSCGIAFPASDTKRRRLAKSNSHVGHNSPTQGPDPHHRDARMSKMSRLLDQVDQGLQHAGRTTTESSGKETGSTSLFSQDATAYIQKLPESGFGLGLQIPQYKPNDTKALGAEIHLHALSQDVARTSLHAKNEETSSEYGGKDLEDDLIGITGHRSQPKPAVNETINNDIAPREATKRAQPTPILEEEEEAEDDNDDDFMDDLTIADLEALAATCDKAEESQPQPALPPLIPYEEDKSAEIETVNAQDIIAEDMTSVAAAVIDLASDDEFNDNDFDDIAKECDELTHVAEQNNTKTVPLLPRHIVKDIYDGVYQTDKGLSRGEKIVHVEDERTKAQRIVYLRDAWLDSPLSAGVTVHVLAHFDHRGGTVIDNARGLLIVHPDHLFSATVVADAFKCTRRAVLQDRVKATNDVTESQVYGTILHEVFQEALRANRWDREWLAGTVGTVCTRFLESLYELHQPLERCISSLLEKLDGVEDWARRFVAPKAHPDAVLQTLQGADETPVAINKLLDVEEHVWAPRYGLKGNIDATVQIHAPSAAHGARTLTVPFELKTGRARNDTAHNSQTALYTLLLSDRYDVQTAFGILHYLETHTTSQVLAPRRDVMHMLMKRNELATYARARRSTLPPMLRNEYTCGRCYAQTACFVYHKLAEGGDGKSSGMGARFKELMGHLDDRHAAFFTKWDDLLTKEEADVVRFRRELWAMLSPEREKVGRCFGGVVIQPGSARERSDGPKINRFEYVFVKQRTSTPAVSFAESQLSVGEPIVISDEQGHYALANGYVTRIRATEVAVAVDRRLHNARTRSPGFDAVTNQSFAGIMEVTDGGASTSRTPSQLEPGEPTVYRIDKDEFSNGMATVRNNLIRMMEHGLFGAKPLRRLIVEGVPPAFRASGADSLAAVTGIEELNVDQRNAIRKVMSAENYALVLGMPGTGKTTTIAHIIRALAAKGKSVLLTSYTHSAVDNILLKIRDADLRILRIGAESKIHPDVQAFADLACRPKSSLEDVERSYKSQVVATTCLGINHAIFNHRTFDYCIVDEASQITLPVCLGPIRMAHRFVLVGDHYQLPPLVQNKEAQEGGLDISLFKLLSDQHPESVVNLEHQYRMCEDIMSLSNTIIYNGLLKCGTPEVATRKMVVPNMDGLKQHHHSTTALGSSQRPPCMGPLSGTCWLRDVVDPNRQVIFLNTDAAGQAARDIVSGSRITNPFEVALTTQIVRALLSVGMRAADIGVMALYRSQLALLRQSLRARTSSSLPSAALDAVAALEMHTADRFQGRDKEAIVLSLVRSNEKGNVGDLLQDWRRVNVALTRARTKLVIVGSFGTVRQGNESLAQLCKLVDARGWRMNLRSAALEEHCFEDWTTQPSGLPEAKTAPKASGKSPARASGKSHKLSPLKTGKGLAPERILKQRPILQDIVNGVIG